MSSLRNTENTGDSAPGKKFAAFDIDGTLFRSGLYREVVYELIRMELLPKKILQVLTPKEKAWQQRSHGSAFYEFDQTMVEVFDNYLKRLKVGFFDEAVKRVIKSHRDNVYVYTRDLAATLKKEGYLLIAISGSQKELVEPFAKHYKFDVWVGAQYERDGDYFTGHVIKTHRSKETFLKQIIKEHGLTLKDSIAVGDTRGDIGMLEMVERPIAFNPERSLLEAAMKNGWKIVVERKNVIYEMTSEDRDYRLDNVLAH